MKTKKRPGKATQRKVDEIVSRQALDDSAWSDPVHVEAKPWAKRVPVSRVDLAAKLHVRADDVKPVSEFVGQAAALIEQVHSTRRALLLTEGGENTAVVVDAAEYERLLDELDLLRDIHTGETQLANGEGVPHEAVRERH